MVATDLCPVTLSALFAGAMVLAAVWDVARFEIPDTLSLVLAVTAAVMLSAAGTGWSGLASHGLGALAAFAFGVLMFALGQWGGGDVKLMTATCLWLGWPALVGYGLVVAVAGGVLAGVVLVFRRLALPAAWAARPWLARLHRADEGLPYGVALGLGGLIYLRPAVASVLGG